MSFEAVGDQQTILCLFVRVALYVRNLTWELASKTQTQKDQERTGSIRKWT